MRLVCIADFRLNEHGLWDSYKDGECLFIEKVLNKSDMETYLYYEKDLGTTTDIAEDLTSFSDELVILVTDEFNYKLNVALANKIIEEEDECKVIFKIREEFSDFNYNDLKNDNFVVVDNFSSLAEEMEEENAFDDVEGIELYNELADINTISDNINVLVGYKTDKINQRSFESIKNDLFKICNNDKKLNITFTGLFIEEIQYGNELKDYLAQYKNKKFIFYTEYKNFNESCLNNVLFNIHLSSEFLENEKLDLSVVKDNINMIVMDSKIFDDVELAKNVINSALKHTNNIQFSCNANIKLDVLKNCIPKKYFDLMNTQYQTLSRGILFSKTGEYVAVPLNGFVKHLYVDKSNLDDEVINFANELCSINSSLLVGGIDNKSNVEEFSVISLDKICKKNSEVSKIEEMADNDNSFPLNIAYIDEDKLNIDGIINDAGLKLIEMPLSDYKPAKSKDYRNMYVFSLDTEKDLDCLMNQADGYYKTKKICKSFLLDGKLKNMCRFMSRNYCSVTKIPRLAINDKREVCPCYEMNEKIGDLTNSVYELTQEVYYQHQMRLKDSKCTTCSANIACSKCVYMPEYLKSKYCDIMINKTYVTDFLIESMILSNLSRINTQMEKLDYKDIVISNEFFQNMIDDQLVGNEMPYFAKYAFLIESKNFYAIWSPNTNKTFSVTKEIAVVCEALFKKLSYKDIIDVVAKYNKMSSNDAKVFCEKVFDILFNNNLLHRQVTIRE